MNSTNSYFDNGLYNESNNSLFNNFEPNGHNLIEELKLMCKRDNGENREYLEEIVNKWIAEIESLDYEDREIFNSISLWTFLLIVFAYDCFSSIKDNKAVKTYIDFIKYMKENKSKEQD